MPEDTEFWVRFTMGGFQSLFDEVKHKLTKEQLVKVYDMALRLDAELRDKQ